MRFATRNKLGSFCLGLAVALGASGTAGASEADGLPYNDIEKTPDGIAYVAGGIGIEAQQRLDAKARADDFNLKLVFTLHEGNYIADVDVVMKDQQARTVLQEMADGPFLFAKLPAGRYTVEATYEGKTETRTINVGETGMRTAYMRWPSNPQTDFIVKREPQPAGDTKGGTPPRS